MFEKFRKQKLIDDEKFNQELDFAKRIYRIKESEELREDVKNLSLKELDEKYGNINVTVVSQITGESYEKTLKKMERVRDRHGIAFRYYTNEKMYLYSGQELTKAVARFKMKEEKDLNLIMADTGWSRSKILREVARLNEKWIVDYHKYAAYRFYEKTDNEIGAVFKKWNDTAKNNREKVQEASDWPMYKIKVHMKRVAIQFNIIAAYYVLYRAWELSDEQLSTYARQEDSKVIWKKFNDKDERKILSQKDKFDVVFKKYINRKFWINVETNYDEFLSFVDGLDYIFCKPINFGGGLGTEKLKVNHDNSKELYDYLMGKGRILVEECVKQHHSINEFISTSVNTIRVVTIVDNGKPKIICTGIRFGYDGITDNFSKNGMVADVDPETGIIRTDAVDKKGNFYKVHPKSGKQFKGFQIPRWNEVIALAKNAMNVLDGINYVGWDIAVSDDKVVIIEGNSMPDLVLIQAPYADIKEGKRYLFEKYL